MHALPLLLVDDIAQRLSCSHRTVYELTRTAAIPHFKPAHRRRCYFRIDWLQAWEQGAPLVVEHLAGGGRVVRPDSEAI